MIVGFLSELGVDLVVTLGALLADVPHTRPCPVTGSATDQEIVQRLGLSASRYEGPTGIVGVLHDACRQAGISSASLWAAVPHYVSLTPSPKAALALTDRLADLIGADIDTSELAEASENYSEQVSEAVASDPDTAAYIEELEQRSDTLAEEADLPSGDALAAELTRFLRERDEQDDDDPPFASEQQTLWGLAEGEGVAPDAGAELQLEQAGRQRRHLEERVEAASVDTHGSLPLSVEQDVHRAVAAEHEMDLPRDEAQPEPRAEARDDLLRGHLPPPCVRELTLPQLVLREAVVARTGRERSCSGRSAAAAGSRGTSPASAR